MLKIKSRIRHRRHSLLTGTVSGHDGDKYIIDWDKPDNAKKLLGWLWGLVEKDEVERWGLIEQEEDNG